MKQYILIFFTVLSLPFQIFSQGEVCDCLEEQTSVIVCYTADDDYCVSPSSGICGYTMDGRQMDNALALKLQNPANFGPNGIVNCGIELVKLPKNPIKQQIYDTSCNIIFIGNHAYNANNGSVNLSSTAIEQTALNEIRDWSLECPSNLVIVTQAEANPWGYRVANVNQNPNFPATNDGFIFNGPFGQVDQFNQGGSFQANFVNFPASGFTVLGVDSQGRPTMLLDLLTNDILLADVGILCSGAGDVSTGENIITENDILALNIFDLGCVIADQTLRTFIDLDFCQDETFTLPSGEVVNTFTIYTDTLTAINGCDSVLIYNLEFPPFDTTLFNYAGCREDNFFVTVNDIRYDYTNPIGSHLFQNVNGCDSLVIVDLTYYEPDSMFFEYEICGNETYEYDGLEYQPDDKYIIQYETTNGCDSSIHLSLTSFPTPVIEITEAYEVQQNEAIILEQIIPANADIEWTPSDGLSCSTCPSPTLLPDFFINDYMLNISDEFGCKSEYQINIKHTCHPYFPNIFSTQSSGINSEFYIETVCPIEDYNLIIYSRWGEEVFQSTTIGDNWNGRFNNQNVLAGVYIYKLTYSQNNESFEVLGNVTVL